MERDRRFGKDNIKMDLEEMEGAGERSGLIGLRIGTGVELL